MIEGLYVGCYYMRCQMLQGRARGLETLLALSGRYHRRLRGPERSRGSITYRSRKKINDNDYTVRGIEPGQPEDKNTHGYTVRKRRRGTRKLLGRAPGPSPRYIQRYINTDIEIHTDTDTCRGISIQTSSHGCTRSTPMCKEESAPQGHTAQHTEIGRGLLHDDDVYCDMC